MVENKHKHPIAEYARAIYIRWDKDKIPCQHNPNGWMAYWVDKYGVNGDKDISGS